MILAAINRKPNCGHIRESVARNRRQIAPLSLRDNRYARKSPTVIRQRLKLKATRAFPY